MPNGKRGGARPGAGRKPRADGPAVVRTVRLTRAEWERVKENAARVGLSVAEYIRRAIL